MAARVLPWLATLALVGGCGDTITILECPLGTRPAGDHCEPWEDEPDAAADEEVDAGVGDFPTVDEPDGEGAGEPGDDTAAGTPDVGPGEPDVSDQADAPSGPAAGATGSPCAKSSDCDGGTCLDWPGGYCTTLDCDEGPGCAAGELCVPFAGGNRICVVGCEGGGACGTGQACKVLDDGDGGVVEACHGVEPDAGSVGSTCGIDDAACAGAATCLASMPGGYCAIPHCEPGSCPGGSECVKLDGVPTCLRACAEDAECDGSEEAERRCGTLKAVGGAEVGVCISGVEGAPMGGACVNDFECESGTCQVLGTGTCSQTGAPCFPETEAESCEASEFCLVTGDGGVGVCTQPCSTAAGCPGTSLCVGQPGDQAEGWCRPPCAGPGDDAACPAGGFTCAFGVALGDPTGQGKYVCARLDPGVAGSACTEDFYCPFPGVCVPDGFPGTCRQACLSASDCADGAACAPFGAGVVQVCQ